MLATAAKPARFDPMPSSQSGRYSGRTDFMHPSGWMGLF
jgi:hypothetical protein